MGESRGIVGNAGDCLMQCKCTCKIGGSGGFGCGRGESGGSQVQRFGEFPGRRPAVGEEAGYAVVPAPRQTRRTAGTGYDWLRLRPAESDQRPAHATARTTRPKATARPHAEFSEPTQTRLERWHPRSR
uniref:Uncharacterized protein n=1 Tax=Eutreptiella gymnastica TaxID=73025 RepID=A0A7S4LPP3_9EUGL